MKLRVTRRSAAAASGLCLLVALASVVGASAGTTQAQPFKVMIISGFNTFSNANPEILEGARAAADAINKAGGLRGRRIEVEPCSNQSSVTANSACARKAVDENYDNVIQRTSFAAGAHPILKQAGIPQVGLVPTLTQDYVAAAFPVVSTSQAMFVAGMVYALKDKSLKRWAGVGVENSGSNLTVSVHTKYLAVKAGRTFVGAFLSPVFSTDYLPVAQKLVTQNVDGIVNSLPVGGHLALNAAMSQLGFRTKTYITNAATFTPSVIAGLPSGAPPGLIAGAELPPATAGNVPVVKQFLDELKAAGLDSPVNRQTASQAGWVAIWAIKKLADRTTGPVTKEKLIAAARAATKKRPIDLFGAIKWTPGAKGPAAVPNNPNGLAWVVKYQNGLYVLAQNDPIDAWAALGIARR